MQIAQLQMFSAGIPKREDAEKFEVNEMPQLYECGETTSDKQWFGVGKRLNCAGLLKLRVTNGRYPQLIATLTDGRDPFNFMVDFDPEKKTQGYAALSFISALAGLYNHAPDYQASFSLTVGGRTAVFINFWVPTDDDANREQANLPLVNDTALMKAEIGLMQQRLGSVPQYEPRCSETLKQLREPIAA